MPPQEWLCLLWLSAVKEALCNLVKVEPCFSSFLHSAILMGFNTCSNAWLHLALGICLVFYPTLWGSKVVSENKEGLREHRIFVVFLCAHSRWIIHMACTQRSMLISFRLWIQIIL